MKICTHNKTHCSPYYSRLIARLVLGLCLICLHKYNFGQAPVIEWQKSLGGTVDDYATSIQQTADGGYIVAGYSNSNNGDVTGNHGNSDYWIVKLSTTGNIQWQKSMGGTGIDQAHSIQQTADGGYIVAGYSRSNNGDVTGNHGTDDHWIVKLSATGNIQWQKSLGSTGSDGAYSIQQTTDGGYIVAGNSASNNGDVTGNHGDFDYWIVKLSATGNIQWQKSLGGTGTDRAESIQQTSDGGYIVAGYSTSNNGDVTGNHGGFDYWIVKLSAAGNIQWQKSLGGTGGDQAHSIQQTSDGGYIVAGYSDLNNGDVTGNHGGFDYWIVKLSATGNIQWQKSLGSTGSDGAYSIQQTTDGGYIVAGNSTSNNGDVTGNHGSNDYWIVKLSATGDIQWQKSLGGAGYDRAQSIQQTSDGGYIVAGYSGSNNNGDVTGYHGNFDYWVVKLRDCVVQPGVINGNTAPCAATTVAYNIDPVAGATTYTWAVPNGWAITEGQGTTSIKATAGSSAGNITVSAGSDCGSSDPQTLPVVSLAVVTPAISIAATATEICEGMGISFTATTTHGGTPPLYQWKKNGVNVGANNPAYTDAALVNNDIITCVLTNNDGCASPVSAVSNDISITVNPRLAPSVAIAATATEICAGTGISFTATVVNGGTAPAYQWQVNGVNAGSNMASFSSSALSDGDGVSCMLTSSESCASPALVPSNTITVTVNTMVSASVQINASKTNICKDDIVVFEATALNAGSSPGYQWQLNGLPVGTNNAVYTAPPLANDDRVSCMVTPDPANSCIVGPAVSNTITIVIEPLPELSISPADTIVSLNSQVRLNVSVSGGNVRSFEWSPAGALVNSSELSPLTVPLSKETQYHLKAANNDGCSITRSVVVKIANPLLLPNMFTPNGDRLNDVFRIPVNVLFTLQSFSIYDRWGKRIFYTTDISRGWDGKSNGAECPTGLYMYVIHGVDSNGPVMRRGSVMMVR